MSIEATKLREAFIAGTANVLKEKEYINELNVFPVPDGDTGTNISMTLKSAYSQLLSLSIIDISSVCKAISSGSLRGARGNSGVIMSQILRGLTNYIKDLKVVEDKDMLLAFTLARDTAYKAVINPKEGTILTVIDAISKKAKELAESKESFIDKFEILVKVGNETLDKTPEMLPILKEAGVVDSGGMGLMIFMKGVLQYLKGENVDISDIENEGVKHETSISISKETESEIKFGYCTEFIVNRDKDYTEKEIEELKTFLQGIGDSLVVVPMDNFIKVHVHTNHPGEAFEKALSMGFLTSMKIDNMRFEHEEKLIKDASNIAKKEDKQKNIGKIVVSNGEGLDMIFKDLGVDVVMSGGQTMNPSTEDFIDSIQKVNAKNIFIFPNNGNIVMAAKQARDIVTDKNIYVVETKHIVEGINCLIYFEEKDDMDAIMKDFKETISHVKTIETTYAVRDTNIDGIEIKQNNYISIGAKKMLATDTDLDTCIINAYDKIKEEGDTLISLYYGNGIVENKANELKEKLESTFPNLEVACYEGKQPVYYYYISVE